MKLGMGFHSFLATLYLGEKYHWMKMLRRRTVRYPEPYFDSEMPLSILNRFQSTQTMAFQSPASTAVKMAAAVRHPQGFFWQAATACSSGFTAWCPMTLEKWWEDRGNLCSDEAANKKRPETSREVFRPDQRHQFWISSVSESVWLRRWNRSETDQRFLSPCEMWIRPSQHCTFSIRESLREFSGVPTDL
jgi:hypothetical protein